MTYWLKNVIVLFNKHSNKIAVKNIVLSLLRILSNTNFLTVIILNISSHICFEECHIHCSEIIYLKNIAEELFSGHVCKSFPWTNKLENWERTLFCYSKPIGLAQCFIHPNSISAESWSHPNNTHWHDFDYFSFDYLLKLDPSMHLYIMWGFSFIAYKSYTPLPWRKTFNSRCQLYPERDACRLSYFNRLTRLT